MDEIANEIRDATFQAHTAQDNKDDRALVTAAHERVAQVVERYRAFLQTLDDKQRPLAERQLGRRLSELQRIDALLPRIGSIAGRSTPDRQVGGASEVGERRITGVSWRNESAPPRAGLSVGGDVEAWCGPCGDLTTHSVVAMIGTQPKQVACQVCGSRHSYRTEPARQATAAAAAAASARARTPEEVEAERRAEELRALARELADATNVRPWDPKQRYKPGEVVAHPDWGRGKVETVLRSSLVARFANGGRKSLMMT